MLDYVLYVWIYICVCIIEIQCYNTSTIFICLYKLFKFYYSTKANIKKF